MSENKTTKLAIIDWTESKPNSLQPLHIISSDLISYTLFDSFAFAINSKNKLEIN